MTDQELLQAIGQVVEAKIEPVRQDIRDQKEQVGHLEQRVITLETRMSGVRVYMDIELNRTLKLLLEGQKAIWDRATPPERYDVLEVRTSALEMAVKQHTQEIQELKLA